MTVSLMEFTELIRDYEGGLYTRAELIPTILDRSLRANLEDVWAILPSWILAEIERRVVAKTERTETPETVDLSLGALPNVEAAIDRIGAWLELRSTSA